MIALAATFFASNFATALKPLKSSSKILYCKAVVAVCLLAFDFCKAASRVTSLFNFLLNGFKVLLCLSGNVLVIF